MGFCLRVGQLLSTCVSFSLGASLGIWKESLANWCMFIWCLCFAMSLITSIVELCGLQCTHPLLLGWFSSCLFLPLRHHLHRDFPSSSAPPTSRSFLQVRPEPTRHHRHRLLLVAALLCHRSGLGLCPTWRHGLLCPPSQVCSGGWRTIWPVSSSLHQQHRDLYQHQPALWCGVWPCTPSASSWGPWSTL